MNLIAKDFKPATYKETLKGFAVVEFPGRGLEIRDLAYHETEGNSWFQLPAKPFAKADGKRGWNYLVAFKNKSFLNEFQESAKRALKAYLAKIEGDANGVHK